MRSAVKLCPLVAALVVVGISLTAKQNGTPDAIVKAVSLGRTSEASHAAAEASGPVEPDINQPVHNGDVARDVAKALRQAKLSDYEIDISVHNGVITLDGFVASSDQQTAAERVAAS